MRGGVKFEAGWAKGGDADAEPELLLALGFFFSFSTCFSLSLNFIPMFFLYFVAVGREQERFVGIGFGRQGWGGTRGLDRNGRGGDFGLGVRYRPAVRIVADGCSAGTARQRGAYLALIGLPKSAKKDKT